MADSADIIDFPRREAPALHAYQRQGAEFLAARRFAYLGDDMGLGKSAQLVTACDLVKARRILVVCPASVRANWEAEFDLFSRRPRDVVVAFDAKARPPEAGVFVVSYDGLRNKKLLAACLAWLAGGVLITDEAHYIKSRKAQRTKAIAGDPVRRTKGLADVAAYWWPASGTPAPNNAAELWPILRKGGVFNGDYWAFVREFCLTVDSGFGLQIVGLNKKNLPRLKKLLASCMIRRKKADVMSELPEITYGYLTVKPAEVDTNLWFPEAAFGDYKTVLNELKKQTQSIVSVIGTCDSHSAQLQALQALQGTNTALLRRFIGLAKVPPVVDVVREELEAGLDKVVLFAKHRDTLRFMLDQLQEYHPMLIYGGTPAAKRGRKIDRFQNDPTCRVFLGQIQAVGTGVNLTAASSVIVVEPDWSPASNAQAVMRVHRMGQERPVTVRFVKAAGAAADEHIVKLLKKKTADLTALFDDENQELSK